jgi:hypothetical protein
MNANQSSNPSADEDKKIEAKIDLLVTKRFEEIKWSISLVAAFMGVISTIFAVLSGFTIINWNNEKNALESYKQNLENKLIGKAGKPDIELFNLDGNQLQDSITRITAIQIEKDELGSIKYRLAIPVVFKNKGNGTPKRLLVKLLIRGIDKYVNNFISVVDVGNEEDKKYPSIWARNYLRDEFQSNIPPGQSGFDILSTEPLDKPLQKGTYAVRLRVYYGEELENNVNANFKILYDEKTRTFDKTSPIKK